MTLWALKTLDLIDAALDLFPVRASHEGDKGASE